MEAERSERSTGEWRGCRAGSGGPKRPSGRSLGAFATPRCLRRRRTGQGLVEFVLVVPMVLFLFFGIVEFGRYYSTRLALRHGVREAARFAVTGNVLTDTMGEPMSRSRSIERVIVQSAPQLGLAASNIVITPSDGGGPGEIVRVDVWTEFDFLVPFVASLFPNGRLEIRVSTVMKNERF